MPIAYRDSNGVAITDTGAVSTTTVTAGADVNSDGLLIAPDGSLVVSTVQQAGSWLNSSKLTFNPDGSLLTKPSADPDAYRNSDGLLINPTDGSLVTATVKDSTAVRKAGSPG